MALENPASGSQVVAQYDFNGRRISIRPFTEDWIPQVKAFNQRMVAGGLDPLLAFPENPSLEYPRFPGAPIWQEAFLAVEDGVMHGAYYFTHERYSVQGAERWIAHYRHPISEVLIDKAYKGLGTLLLSDAQRRQPLLYGLGLGGPKNPNLLRLIAEGWRWVFIPFWAKVVRPPVFLRQIAFLRKTAVRRLLLDAAAASGIGWLGIHALQAFRAKWNRPLSAYSTDLTEDFGPWADELWELHRSQRLYAAVRDRAALNVRYPLSDGRLQRIKISSAGRVVGWAVVIGTRMHANAYFGDMHVGTIVDCLAMPGHESAVVHASAAQLKAAGADLLVSNQAAGPWCEAFKRAGFFSGPSNYILALSPELADKLEPLAESIPLMHVNRGDGAGTSRL